MVYYSSREIGFALLQCFLLRYMLNLLGNYAQLGENPATTIRED